MRRTAFISLVILAVTASVAKAQNSSNTWYDDKYSMFIHFGLYSALGGVWEGNEIHRGYSEQIQSHAGIYSDVYEKVADTFDPVNFNADEIVALAKRAGMRSVVITSKHHDGFCMFKTETTDFNSYDSTPSHRDYMMEMSEACRRGGVKFGMYFSLVDWHYPGASNITSHNANPIPEVHHQLNLAQVKELVTRYGDVSELWFDMGSLSPQQSRELYNLVHEYQPSCMVSGRLGNGYYDFAVMSDNYYPEATLQTPWQSCASMFDETWGYRSWQVRGSSHDKAQEKLRSLIRVASGGGNFLLNIGPMDDGAVVPFEAAVLEEIGKWLDRNGEAIYGTTQSPFRSRFAWGGVTRKSNVLYLILSGKRPSSGEITLPVKDNKLLKAEGPAKVKLQKDALSVKFDADAYTGDIKVVKLTFKRPVLPAESKQTNTRITKNSYCCQDYYTNYRSDVSYTWNTHSTRKLAGVCFTYTATDVDKQVEVTLDGKPYAYTLHEDAPKSIMQARVAESNRYVCHTRKSTFDADAHDLFSPSVSPDGDKEAKWQSVALDHQTVEARPFQTVYVMETVTSPCEQEVIMEVGAGNGVELYVNGYSVMKHLNPYRCAYRMEKVRVNLRPGDNQIVLRAYNRHERNIEWHLKVSDDQNIYSTPVYLPDFRKSSSHTVTIRQADEDSQHKDCELYNLRMIF